MTGANGLCNEIENGGAIPLSEYYFYYRHFQMQSP
jgi:hypothetical protein